MTTLLGKSCPFGLLCISVCERLSSYLFASFAFGLGWGVGLKHISSLSLPFCLLCLSTCMNYFFFGLNPRIIIRDIAKFPNPEVIKQFHAQLS